MERSVFGDEPRLPVRESVHYRGVRKRKWGKWVSEVRLPNSRERIWLGSYSTAEQAARAYDAAVFCLRGPGANFNFPATPRNIPSADRMTRAEIRAVARLAALEGGEGGNRAEEAAGASTLSSGDGSSGFSVLENPLEGFPPENCYSTPACREDAEDEFVAEDDGDYFISLWNF